MAAAILFNTIDPADGVTQLTDCYAVVRAISIDYPSNAAALYTVAYRSQNDYVYNQTPLWSRLYTWDGESYTEWTDWQNIYYPARSAWQDAFADVLNDTVGLMEGCCNLLVAETPHYYGGQVIGV